MVVNVASILLPAPVTYRMNPFRIMAIVDFLLTNPANVSTEPVLLSMSLDHNLFELIDGRHRLIAHHIAGRHQINAVIQND